MRTDLANRQKTLESWITEDSIPFSLDSSEIFNSAVDKVMTSLGDSVELLGFGEALHGGKEILLLRNRLFKRLVEAHGYSAIAIESSFPKAHIVNEYVAGCGPTAYDAIQDTGFSHGFGRLEANRELVEWMRQYNADPSHSSKLQFYGFDSPTEMTGTDSPGHTLRFVLDYLTSVDSTSGNEHRKRIHALLGEESKWEDPAAMMDPTKSVGLSQEAIALRIETEELISELSARRPELVAKSDEGRFLEALQFASEARQLLNYHAELARKSADRTARLLGIRDAMMADNVVYVMARERDRGNVFVFAHNSHLQRGMTQWQLGADTLTWWPVGAHLSVMLGARYAAMGSAVGISDENGITQPESGSLEARLTVVPGPGRFIPTYQGQGLPTSEIAAFPIRSGSQKNSTYFALTSQSITDFDWLAVLDSVGYAPGAPPLP